MSLSLVITCAEGLEEALALELADLGITGIRQERGVVQLRATQEQAYRICLWSRVGTRVLLPLMEAKGSSADDLYAAALAFNWVSVLDPKGTMAVHATVAKGIKAHTQYLALKLKDAIADHCRQQHGVRPDVDTDKPDVRLQVHQHAEGFSVSLDLSGDSMHRRGYRIAMTDAPLKETLAAALLIRSGWCKENFSALLDPMCGSGTFLIEAAWMVADVAPGLLRDHYGFMGWQQHDDALWQRLYQEALQRREAAKKKLLPPIFGFDASPDAVDATRRNIRAAGVAHLIHLEIGALNELEQIEQSFPKEKGLLICNPPYGERLGEKAAARDVYRALGRIASQQLGGWQACILAADIQHVDALGFTHRATERLHNGAMTIYARHADIPAIFPKPVHVFTEAETEFPEEARDFANRLRKNLKAAQKKAEAEAVYCYRVYDADMPEFNLAVDVYEDKLHVQEYAPPKSIDPEKAEARFKLALLAIRHVFGLRRESVFIKVRSRQKGKQQYEKQATLGRFFEVRDSNAWVLVNLTDYLDTGLFLDHRLMRLRLGKEARGKHFLNLFAYTGVASVHAALGGAASTTTVDLSATYLGWAQRNFALNGLPMDNHHFEQADCLAWLRDCEYVFDLIFIDPPTFSNSKRTPDVFDVQEDHVELIWQAMRALTEDGTLYFSNNFRKFKLDTDALVEFEIEDMSTETIGFDFERNPNIHRCWKIRHRKQGGAE